MGVDTVAVRYTKWGGLPHWHFRLDRLGEDDHGVWLAGPPGILLQRGDEPPSVERDGFVLLVPATGRWMAFWNRRREPEIYVDVTSTPTWLDAVPTGDGVVVTAVDLDLDVIRGRDGSTSLLDADEFAEHQVALSYPPEVVEQAEATARWLLRAVGARIEPFGADGARWLERLGSSPLPHSPADG